jgi:hypothetical protein
LVTSSWVSYLDHRCALLLATSTKLHFPTRYSVVKDLASVETRAAHAVREREELIILRHHARHDVPEILWS